MFRRTLALNRFGHNRLTSRWEEQRLGGSTRTQAIFLTAPKRLPNLNQNHPDGQSETGPLGPQFKRQQRAGGTRPRQVQLGEYKLRAKSIAVGSILAFSQTAELVRYGNCQ